MKHSFNIFFVDDETHYPALVSEHDDLAHALDGRRARARLQEEEEAGALDLDRIRRLHLRAQRTYDHGDEPLRCLPRPRL